MKALLQFEFGNYFRKPGFYLFLLFLLGLGLFTGSNFSLSLSPDIFKNSSYTIGYMTGFLSLFSIFFAVIFTAQVIFREKEANFSLILYATPIRKQDYLLSRFAALFGLSLLSFTIMLVGFGAGQFMESGGDSYSVFNLSYYILPLLLFGLINTFFCTAVLSGIGWLSGNRFMVYVSGLFLYIAYMVLLIFSGSPLMAKSMPQSETMIRMSALLDPFGLSGFFLQTSHWSVPQRNTELLLPSGLFLWNRMSILVFSLLLLLIVFKRFSFSFIEKRSKKTVANLETFQKSNSSYKTVITSHEWKSTMVSLLSFVKLNLKYTVKSIPFSLICLGLLFCTGMEMYGMIEKGIRIPQQYASSGLMAKTIIDTFHSLGLIVILFYGHEIVWRSRNSNFHLIENTTPVAATTLFYAQWLSLNIIILGLSSLMIVLGLAFQWIYGYPQINWNAYAGIYLFNSLPLIISAAIILGLQRIINRKYAALVITSVVIFFTATSLGKNFFSHPLLRFQMPMPGLYSDMNGYGAYVAAFGWRVGFGICVAVLFSFVATFRKRSRLQLLPSLAAIAFLITGFFAANAIVEDFRPKTEETVLAAQADYEKKFRRFQSLPQPVIVDVTTNIDLFSEKNAYRVSGKYELVNKTQQPITQILVSFNGKTAWKAGWLAFGKTRYEINQEHSIITLKKPMLPGEKAAFDFSFSYHWSAVNGHDSFNAIVENGTFMRISRYYPQLGYDSGNEISDGNLRKEYGLKSATQIKKWNAPTTASDFIRLKMTISTEGNQTAIGVGDLTREWKQNARNYFQYEATAIPFRFAVASAKYAIQKTAQNGIPIEVYYHPSHAENVAHLLKNARLALAYCETNFGKYPFKAVRFAEISGFTRGFAATAYPGSVYMPENMIFHANIKADKQQDVINELAGHELSHLWWGNSQIAPDDREGNVMLTETLAMYTELMLVKRMHGHKRVMENVALHLGIYLGERGFNEEQPLYKVLGDNTHLSYSKGMVAMYQLGEMIGEQKVNLALKNLLQHHGYPNPGAVSMDFINELYAVTNPGIHPKIDDLLKRITIYNFNIEKASVRKSGKKHELDIIVNARKFYENGKGQKSPAPFSDRIQVAFYYENGPMEIRFFTVKNGHFGGKLFLDQNPVKIKIDPDCHYINENPEGSEKSIGAE